MERVPQAADSGSGVERCSGGRLGSVLRSRVPRALLRGAAAWAAAWAGRAFTAALESALTAVLLYVLHNL
ncbi:hypothetical protein AB0I49_34685 [Streptomyces sp. NPDC050617]|uniref:hypothetical protein n=1 Tax=Streptomyces sp. NPDC050617 TaxID=3154628 RepID=UPI0034385E05